MNKKTIKGRSMVKNVQKLQKLFLKKRFAKCFVEEEAMLKKTTKV